MIKKTLCIITPWMALGGADRCGLDLLKLYNSIGFRTIVIATAHDDRWHQNKAEFAKYSDKIYIGPDIVRVIAFEKPTIIVINNSHAAYDQISEIRNTCGSSHISCLMHMLLAPPWDFENRIKRFSPLIDSVVTVSHKLKNELITSGIHACRITPIHWFGFQSLPGICRKPNDKPTVLCPFRFHTQKRPEFVIDIAAEFIRLGGNAVFKFIGEGEEEANIRERAKLLGVEAFVEFGGRQDFDAMLEFYLEANALLCPSIDEGIPLAYYEAMQCGIPLAVSDVGAVSELVPRQYMVKYKCRNEACRYAQKLFNHLYSTNTALIERYRKSRDFSYAAWKEKVFNLYRIGSYLS